jgi:hypothetical protein
MALYVKSGALGGGSWRAIPDGTLRIKSGGLGGGSWWAPSYLYTKYGSGWRDSGYRGLPVAPTGLAVNAWATHSTVSFKWTAGAGGAPIAKYILAINNEANNARVQEWEDTASPSSTRTLSQGTKYHVYIRAETAGGLTTGWVGPLKIKMGTDDASYYTTEQSTRAWSEAASVNGYKDALVGVSVATHRAVQTVTYNISANAGFTSVLSPYNNREIYRLGNSGQGERFSWGASVNYTLDVGDYWGNGGITGMICRGTGWATGPASHVARAVGTITVNGYELYNYQLYHPVPAVANGYW